MMTAPAGAPNTSNEVFNCAPDYTLYIPLQFWFCRNPGLALPLIALQYHEVRINLEFNDLRNLCWDISPQLSNVHTIRDRVANANLQAASLYVDYIYLDTDERRKFAQVSHEYLIETLQFTGAESITSLATNSSSTSTTLARNSSGLSSATLSCLAMTASSTPGRVNSLSTSPTGGTEPSSRLAYSVTRVEGMAGRNPVVTALLQLNGHDRFQVREGRYFNEVQPYQHHTNVPAVGINVYSFALQPEHSPAQLAHATCPALITPLCC
jgi:hypothetical protein